MAQRRSGRPPRTGMKIALTPVRRSQSPPREVARTCIPPAARSRARPSPRAPARLFGPLRPGVAEQVERQPTRTIRATIGVAASVMVSGRVEDGVSSVMGLRSPSCSGSGPDGPRARRACRHAAGHGLRISRRRAAACGARRGRTRRRCWRSRSCCFACSQAAAAPTSSARPGHRRVTALVGRERMLSTGRARSTRSRRCEGRTAP